MVFPSNFIPDLDFTVIDSLGQLDEVVRRVDQGVSCLRDDELTDQRNTYGGAGPIVYAVVHERLHVIILQLV